MPSAVLDWTPLKVSKGDERLRTWRGEAPSENCITTLNKAKNEKKPLSKDLKPKERVRAKCEMQNHAKFTEGLSQTLSLEKRATRMM